MHCTHRGTSARKAHLCSRGRRLDRSDRSSHGVRFTSAHAERTSWCSPSTGAATAHLRSRGDDCAYQSNAHTMNGSLPLARRGRVAGMLYDSVTRLTSARAERTRGSATTSRRSPSYLRSRGEGFYLLNDGNAVNDSPPLVRRGRDPHQVRPRTTAHLRSRGETEVQGVHVSGASGLPPLARRGPGFVQRFPNGDLLTSARAERTTPPL
jgi:hypothetical protein